MTLLSWKTIRNLENSLTEFLQDSVTTQSLTVLDENGNEKAVAVRTGWKVDDSWTLPTISIYADDRTLPRLEIGSSRRQKSYLVIIDIRTSSEGNRMDLATWVEETINDGWNFYEYIPNPSDPDNPLKTLAGYVSIEFVTSSPVRLGENVDLFDKYRHGISVTANITGDC